MKRSNLVNTLEVGSGLENFHRSRRTDPNTIKRVTNEDRASSWCEETGIARTRVRLLRGENRHLFITPRAALSVSVSDPRRETWPTTLCHHRSRLDKQSEFSRCTLRPSQSLELYSPHRFMLVFSLFCSLRSNWPSWGIERLN